MVCGRAYGKVILCGEHFVVEGLPGIVAELPLYVEVCAESMEEHDVKFIDTIFSERVQRSEDTEHILIKIFDAMFSELALSQLKLTITGTLPAQKGLGYSAALAVAIARAVSDYKKFAWSDEEINRLAFKAEKISHGNPSGIDNTCATYGGVLCYKKGTLPFKKILLSSAIHLLLVNTGKKSSTKEAIETVVKFKHEKTEEFSELCRRYEEIEKHIEKALKQRTMQTLAQEMNANHTLLKKLGLSTPEIEVIVKEVLNQGALAAKITGAGKGGFVLVLTKDSAHQKKLEQFLQKNEFETIKISLK